MTVLFLTAYALELVGCALAFDKNAVLFVSSFVAFGLIFGVLMLSTILYLIGVSSVTSDLTNSQEVLNIQKASLIDEDWPDDDLSFD